MLGSIIKRPLATGGAVFALGVFAGQVLLDSGFISALPWIAICCTIPAALTGIVFLVFKIRKRIIIAVAIMLLVFGAGTGWRWAHYRIWIVPALELEAKNVRVDMLVTDYPSQSLYGWMTPVKLKSAQVAFFTDSLPDAGPGDTISGRVNISRYESSGYLLKATQSGSYSVKHTDIVPLLLQPARLRRALLDRIDMLFGDVSILPKALTTGDKTAFSDSLSRALSVSGLSHTVAVSGLHVSFISGVIMFLVGGPRRSAFVAIPVIWLFAAVVGFPASAVRAVMMNTLVLLAPVLRRDYERFSALGIAAAVVALSAPNAVGQIGFQLSFAATLGILMFTERWRDGFFVKMPRLSRTWLTRALTSTFATTLAALVFTTPLTAWYFGSVSLIAPVSNLLMLQLITFLFIGTLLACALSVVWIPLGMALAWPLKLGFLIVENFSALVARIPFASLYAERMLIVFFLLYIYALLFACYYFRRRGEDGWVLPLCAAVCALCITLVASVLPVPDTMQFTAADVGQGQSVMVATGGRTAVIDCGGMSEDAGASMADLLLSQGRGTVDMLVLSHYHSDHCNGVMTLLDAVNVSVLIVPPLSGKEEDSELEWRDRIETLCNERGTVVLYADHDLSIAMEDCDIQVFAPRGNYSANDQSLSVLGMYHGFSFLTTGDMDFAMERNLLGSAEIPVTSLYLVGHHGSKYASSETLLQHIRPQAAIVSVGANSFGHPTQETLSRLESVGTSVYRTDMHGNVTVTVRKARESDGG